MKEETKVIVYLSSTKSLITTGQEKLKNWDIPICSVISLVDKPAKKINKKILKDICRQMAKTVYVNKKKKYLFVGEDPFYPNTALVEYEIKDNNQFGNIFLERWEKTKVLLLEFNLYDKKKKYLFTLKGLWDDEKHKWISLKALNHRTIVITQSEDSETIISKG